MSKRAMNFQNDARAFMTVGPVMIGGRDRRAENAAAARAIREQLGTPERIPTRERFARKIGLLQEQTQARGPAKARSADLNRLIREASGLPVEAPKVAGHAPRSGRRFEVRTPMLSKDTPGYRGAS
jgi:hypothetical protein